MAPFSSSLSLSLSLAVVMTTTATTNAQTTRQECLDSGGTVVGDIGNGAIFATNYLCEGSNLPPTDVVVASEGEPIASEGEVCCPTDLTLLDDGNRTTTTRQECTDDLNGTIVGDIGDGATQRNDYVCESNGQAPLANIVTAPGDETIAVEGEVCCGGGQGETTESASTRTEEPTSSPDNSGSAAADDDRTVIWTTILLVIAAFASSFLV